jgi:Raf kinase inhibitor-like YbhB/YbcL family protein
MKKVIFFLLCVSIILSSEDSFAGMKFRSTDFKPGKKIGEAFAYDSFGCSGDNKVPSFTIKGVAKEAKSLAITMYDPDAPTGSGWWHWIAYDIEPTITQIDSGVMTSQEVRYGRNDYGTSNYGGPCPPKGTTHRYIFTLYALDVDKLDIPRKSSAALIGYNLNSRAIKKSEFSSTYTRKK